MTKRLVRPPTSIDALNISPSEWAIVRALANVSAAGLRRNLSGGAAASAFPLLQPDPPLWMTIAAAAEYSGLSASLLRRLAHERIVKAFQDRGWKISRLSLDAFDPDAVKIPRRKQRGEIAREAGQ